REGEVFGLFGPNGAGKTTCLRVLSGLTRPTGGQATVCGVDVGTQPNEVRKRLGILFDLPTPYEDMTVRDYLVFFARMSGIPRAQVPEHVAGRCTSSSRRNTRIAGLGSCRWANGSARNSRACFCSPPRCSSWTSHSRTS